MRRRLAEHLPRFFTDGQRSAVVHILCHNGRLAQYDALPLYVHEHVGRAQIDPNVQLKSSRSDK